MLICQEAQSLPPPLADGRNNRTRVAGREDIAQTTTRSSTSTSTLSTPSIDHMDWVTRRTRRPRSNSSRAIGKYVYTVEAWDTTTAPETTTAPYTTANELVTPVPGQGDDVDPDAPGGGKPGKPAARGKCNLDQIELTGSERNLCVKKRLNYTASVNTQMTCCPLFFCGKCRFSDPAIEATLLNKNDLSC